MKSKLRPRCFFDIDIGHSPAGRIVFELYDDLCPKTSDNFVKLCTGECGISETTGKKLHYINSIFHRVIKGFMIQGGDFSNSDGTGGESIYGGRFSDENLDTPHDKPFLLSMANCGPNTNGSQFFITTKPAPHLDGKHVVFGHVVSGENLIDSIENLPVNGVNKPVVEATISNCGELIPVRKKKLKRQKEKEASVDSSSKGKKKKKSKKKKHRNKRKTKTVKEDEAQTIYPKCSVRLDEIPEVPKPYYLYRGNLKEEYSDKIDNKEVVESSQYVSKDIIGRSGRLIKGRGQLKYYSKSPHDRLDTPPHWNKESYKPQENVEDRYSNRRKSPSASSNKDRQTSRQSRRENASPRLNYRNNDNNNNRNREKRDSVSGEKRKKYDVWKDVSDKYDEKRYKKREKFEDYEDIDKIDKSNEKVNQKNNFRKRSSSLDKIKPQDRDKNNLKPSKSKYGLPNTQRDKVDGPQSGTIIYPYKDESDDSLKHKRPERIIDNKANESKLNIDYMDSSDKKDEIRKKSSRNDYHESSKIDHTIRKRSSSSDNYKYKSKSPIDTKRHAHSPPAHLVAKWQDRREKMMIRRSPMSRSIERNQSRSRYSPRKRSSRYSKSPKSDKNSNENKHHEEHKVSNNIRKISVGKSKDRSSSGTMDSSLSSAGSSVINDSTSNQQPDANKEKKVDISSTNVEKKENKDIKNENSIEKETIMVLKPPEKPWLTSQWKTEEEANKRNAINNSILAKLREDDQKKKSQEKQEKPTIAISESRQDMKKIQSPISQSISKYRSASGTKSSDNYVRSSYSSSSSSRSYSKKQSSCRSRSHSRSRSRSRSRSKSSYRRRYRRSRYHRSSRRSTSRSNRRYRSRSRSSRRRYSSRSTSTSRSSLYLRSARRNYRGLGFRRPSVSPRPRK